MIIFEECLLEVADAYAQQVSAKGGKSLARVASIVVNHSAFFDRLRSGQTCFVRNLQRVAAYFALPENWPDGAIPPHVSELLIRLGAVTTESAPAALLPKTFR